MRSILALATVLTLAGIGSGVAVSDAAALPKFEASKVGSGLAENVGWRRDSRRPGYVTIAPRERYFRRAPIMAEPEDSAAIVLMPGSCGEFKFWNGTTCVDKRYMDRHFN